MLLQLRTLFQTAGFLACPPVFSLLSLFFFQLVLVPQLFYFLCHHVFFLSTRSKSTRTFWEKCEDLTPPSSEWQLQSTWLQGWVISTRLLLKIKSFLLTNIQDLFVNVALTQTFSIYVWKCSPLLRAPSTSWASYGERMQIGASQAAAALGRHGAVLPRRRHGDSGVTGDEVTSRWGDGRR